MITRDKIVNVISELCIKANIKLRPDVLRALKNAFRAERKRDSKYILKTLIENAYIASRDKIPICQDTGLPVVFVEIGDKAKINFNIKEAIVRGVEKGYKEGYLRNSIILEPLTRKGPSMFFPPVIHFDYTKGRHIKITVLPKGFGSENRSVLKMFKPTASIEDIKKYIIDSVDDTGADACPPYIIGIGIGGTADMAGLLAKKSLLRPLDKRNRNPLISKVEDDLLRAVNRLGIGPAGLGGRFTCLAVAIEEFPTHIAGLPVAVNICCHALRSATEVL